MFNVWVQYKTEGGSLKATDLIIKALDFSNAHDVARAMILSDKRRKAVRVLDMITVKL